MLARKMTATSEIETRKLLVSLLAANQRRILAYIHTLAPNPHDAEDLFQETCGVICEKFDEFEAGSNFIAWAFRIALLRVRAARTTFARSKVHFSDKVIDALSDTAAAMQAEIDPRHDALTECMQRLPERDRELILNRYERGADIQEVARALNGRSLEAAYKGPGRESARHYSIASITGLR